MEEDTGEANLNSNSMIGGDSPKTIKLVGEIRGRRVIALIDSGATHNFIFEKLVVELKILVRKVRYTVVLGDDRKVSGIERCAGLQLTLPELVIRQNFLPFCLGGVDVILGMEWLKGLREVKINWGHQTMKFRWEGKKIELKGKASLQRVETSLKILFKLIRKKGEAFWVELNSISEHTPVREMAHELEITELLGEFEALFKEPQGLPPKREQDHAICIRDEAQPPNLCPYRYPYY